jgi:hypothetical protein
MRRRSKTVLTSLVLKKRPNHDGKSRFGHFTAKNHSFAGACTVRGAFAEGTLRRR